MTRLLSLLGVEGNAWARRRASTTLALFVGFSILLMLWQLETHGYGIPVPESIKPVSFKPKSPPEPQKEIPHHDFEPPGRPAHCDSFPDDRIAIGVKTGATEALDKLPKQLETSLSCVREPMYFSDLEQTIGPHKIHDVIARFPSDLMENNPDFDIYRKQRQLVAEGRASEIPSLSSIPITVEDWRTPHKNAAWGLDKYKFLYMIEMAWELQPDRDWYVFLEADTYLSIPNLHRWLATLDPTQKLYFGEPVKMREHSTPLWFAYGGAGIVLSGAAVREFCVDRKGIANRYASRVREWWFGDFVLADALDEVLHLQITNALPSINPDEPAMIAFGEHNWCEPVITLHHLDADGFDRIWRAEGDKGFDDFLFRDVYAASYPDGTLPTEKRENWNNADFRNHTIKPPTTNVKPPDESSLTFRLKDPRQEFAACELACQENSKCMQFTFTETTVSNATTGRMESTGECLMSNSIRLGQEKVTELVENGPEPGKKTWASGWMNHRIGNWTEMHWACTETEFATGAEKYKWDG